MIGDQLRKGGVNAFLIKLFGAVEEWIILRAGRQNRNEEDMEAVRVTKSDLDFNDLAICAVVWRGVAKDVEVKSRALSRASRKLVGFFEKP
eukprot:7461340-Pyramimonas_sp.AAC.1